MTENAGSDKPPPYSPGNKDFPQHGGAYPPSGGGGYPVGGARAAQPGYGQAVIISQPGAAGQVIFQPRPPDYMTASVFACLCCFSPTGLCAIYYASQANRLASIGDMEGATRMSNNARNLIVASIVFGIIWIVLVVVLRVVVISTY